MHASHKISFLWVLLTDQSSFVPILDFRFDDPHTFQNFITLIFHVFAFFRAE